MHQLGNLALICAKRNDVILTVHKWLIGVNIRNKEETTYLILWDDEEKISNLIHELNFGAYAPKEKEQKDGPKFK